MDTQLATTKEANFLFHKFDVNNKGYLTRKEFKMAILAFYGFKPTKVRLEEKSLFRITIIGGIGCSFSKE
jgi:hypothetical protein